MGGWDAFDALHGRDESGNLTVGKTLLLDSRNCTAYAVDKLIATVGVEDLIIVQAEDAVLVCPADQAQRVKEIVEALSVKRRKFVPFKAKFLDGFRFCFFLKTCYNSFWKAFPELRREMAPSV